MDKALYAFIVLLCIIDSVADIVKLRNEPPAPRRPLKRKF